MNAFRRIALASLAAPLALGLAACSDSETADGEVAEGEAIAAIPAPDGTSWAETVAVSDYDGYVMGNPDAPIKVIEYGSLTCGACAAFAADGIEPLRDKYVASGVVSYELRNQVHNGLDLVLARLVRCGAPESFHPLSEQIWLNLESIFAGANTNPQVLEQAMSLPEDQRFVAVAQGTGLLDFFAARGLATDQARACLADSASVMAIAERSDTQSKELEVSGTPTFFINGKNIGTQNWASLEPMLQRAGAR
ncbi:MAG: thioredoxin domain-containing protein [Sphingomonadaceae bacterium]|nr:thioredoxin domain-containing protein [Sphingomonadaceae bacterium]